MRARVGVRFFPIGVILSSKTIDILVRMPNWLGDCVMAMPALRHLAETLPGSRIFLAGRRGFAELFSAQSGVAGFIEAPESGVGKLLKSMSDTRRIIRESGIPEGVDLGLLFTNSLSTAAWMWRSGARTRIGYDLDCRRFFLSHPVPCGGVEQSWHFVRYYLWLVKFAESVLSETGDIRTRQLEPLAEYMTPSLAVSEAMRDGAYRMLSEAGIAGDYAVIAPASAYGPVKDWPAEHYRALVERISGELSLPVVVTGGAAQRDVCESIVAGRRGVVNLAGRTGLGEFAALLAGSSLFVGGDSGGAHVAAALGVPTVVIFGITNPTRTCPTGKRVRMLGVGEERDVKLSTPKAREEALRALSAIAPSEVFAAACEARAL